MTFIRAFGGLERKLLRKYGKPEPLIAVAGLAGVGKTTVAKGLSRKLGVPHINAGMLFRKEARRRGLSLEGFLRKMKEIETHEGTDFDSYFDSKVLEESYRRGGAVVEGRLSGVLLGTAAKARVWVDCPQYFVATRIARRERKGRTKAGREIMERNSRDVERYRRKYGIDFSSKKFYNFFIDNSGSEEEAVNEAYCRIKSLLSGKDSIAISGHIGSGKSAVARVLARKLGFRYVSAGGIFRKTAKEMRLSVTGLLDLCKKRKRIHHLLDRRMASEVRRGRCIADGKLSVWLCDAGLKVFLAASKSERARRLTGRESISLRGAMKELALRDRKEEESFTAAYPKLKFRKPPADVTIDTTKMGIEEVAEKILRYFR